MLFTVHSCLLCTVHYYLVCICLLVTKCCAPQCSRLCIITSYALCNIALYVFFSERQNTVLRNAPGSFIWFLQCILTSYAKCTLALYVFCAMDLWLPWPSLPRRALHCLVLLVLALRCLARECWAQLRTVDRPSATKCSQALRGVSAQFGVFCGVCRPGPFATERREGDTVATPIFLSFFLFFFLKNVVCSKFAPQRPPKNALPELKCWRSWVFAAGGNWKQQKRERQGDGIQASTAAKKTSKGWKRNFGHICVSACRSFRFPSFF